MATLSMFNGIIIRMRPEKNTRHHKPHIHARYQGVEATFDVATRKPFGRMPRHSPLISGTWYKLGSLYEKMRFWPIGS